MAGKRHVMPCCILSLLQAVFRYWVIDNPRSNVGKQSPNDQDKRKQQPIRKKGVLLHCFPHVSTNCWMFRAAVSPNTTARCPQPDFQSVENRWRHFLTANCSAQRPDIRLPGLLPSPQIPFGKGANWRSKEIT